MVLHVILESSSNDQNPRYFDSSVIQRHLQPLNKGKILPPGNCMVVYVSPTVLAAQTMRKDIKELYLYSSDFIISLFHILYSFWVFIYYVPDTGVGGIKDEK